MSSTYGSSGGGAPDATRITVPSIGRTGDLATGNLSNIVTPTTYTFYMKDSACIRTGALDCSVNKLPLDSELRKTIVSEWKTQYKNSTAASLVACCPTNMTREQFNSKQNENWVDTQLDASTIRPLLSNRMTLQWLTVKLRAAKYDVKFLYREDAIVFPPTQFREIVEYLIHHYGNVLAQTYNSFERTKPYPMNTALVVEYNLWCEHTLGLPYVSPTPRTYKKEIAAIIAAAAGMAAYVHQTKKEKGGVVAYCHARLEERDAAIVSDVAHGASVRKI
jgi:hypothetical protein